MRLNGLAIVASTLILAACGGDDGGGGGNNPPVNQPPQIGDVDTDVTIAENSTGIVTTITFTDEDAEGVVLSLEGADSAQFTIDGNGNVRFINPPDFEAPTDNDGNNVYEVVAVATDARGSRATISITVTVTNVVDFTAQRYLEPIFPEVTTLGTLSVPTPDGGTIGVSLIGPSFDTVDDRPLVLISSGNFLAAPEFSPMITAAQFAQRGYLVGLIDATGGAMLGNSSEISLATAYGARDVFTVTNFLIADAAASNRFGFDGSTVFVAGEGSGALVASLSASLDAADRLRDASLTAVFDQSDASQFAPISGALSISGGSFNMGLVDANSGVLFAAHRTGNAFSAPNFATPQSMTRGFQSVGVPAQVVTYDGIGHGFSAGQINAIHQGAANLFYHQVVKNRD